MPQVLYALSLASGVAALVYEVVWARMLSLSFGSTTLAASTVVAAFMGGMGLGAWGYHRVQARVRSALRLYGVIEVAIAVATFALTLTFEGLPELVAALGARLPGDATMAVSRFVLVFGLLLVPAFLMGATYPALCTVLISSREGVDRHLGVLYGLNTLGAGLGALLAGLLLIEAFGLRASVLVGNAINLSVGATALVLASRAEAPGVDSEPARDSIPTSLPYWLTGLVLFGSGLATLSYEILWFRGLRYLVGSSTYALTIILAVFLAGLGLGALSFRRAARRPHPERDLGAIQLAIAVLALFAIGAEAFLLSQPGLRGYLSVFYYPFGAFPWWLRLTIHGGIALAIMLPATWLMGLSFPLASRLFLGSVERLGARVGGAYLLSNLGSIVGSLGAALVLLPWLGTVWGTRAVACLNLALGALVLWHIGHPRRVAAFAGATVLAAVVAAALPSRLGFEGAGLGKIQYIEGELLFEEEGDLGTVQVRQHPRGAKLRGMSIDGTIIGVSRGWNYDVYSKQILLSHLPLVLDRRIAKTLNIGLGSASTLEATASHGRIEVLDCVEINRGVVRGAGFFEESAVLGDPRVRLYVDDASHFLLRTTRSYDLIVSDGKQSADYSGNAKLLSRDFYLHARGRLAEDGIFVQWIPLGTLPADFRSTLRTFADVFEHVEVFYDPPASVLLHGSRREIVGRPRLEPRELERLRAANDLRRFGIDGVEALLARWVASRSQILAMLPESTPISTWDHTRLEFAPYRAKPEDWSTAAPDNLELLIRMNESGDPPARTAFAPETSPAAASTSLLRRAFLERMRGREAEARAWAAEALERNPDDRRAAQVLESLGGVSPDPRS